MSKLYKSIQEKTTKHVLVRRDYHKMDYINAEQYKALCNARPDIGLGYHKDIGLSLRALQ